MIFDPAETFICKPVQSSDNDMTDEEGTVVSYQNNDVRSQKEMNLDQGTPPSIAPGTKIGPLSRQKSRTSCDGDIDDTDSELSPAGSYYQDCQQSGIRKDGTSSVPMSITIPGTHNSSASALEGLFLICEALERPHRSFSAGSSSSEISSPANSPLSGSPTQQQPIDMALTSPELSIPSACTYSNSRSCSSSAKRSKSDRTSVSTISSSDTYHQRFYEGSTKAERCRSDSNLTVVGNDDKKYVNNNDSSSNPSYFPLSTLFNAAEALLPEGGSSRCGVLPPSSNLCNTRTSKPAKRAYVKKADREAAAGKLSLSTSNSTASGAYVKRKSNAGRKVKSTSAQTLTEKDIESKKRKREADKSLSTKKRYDASEKLAIVVEKLRTYFAMELHKL